MKADEWRKVKKMLPYCTECAFMEVKLDAKGNYTFHRYCNYAGGTSLINIASCPQKRLFYIERKEE